MAGRQKARALSVCSEPWLFCFAFCRGIFHGLLCRFSASHWRFLECAKLFDFQPCVVGGFRSECRRAMVRKIRSVSFRHLFCTRRRNRQWSRPHFNQCVARAIFSGNGNGATNARRRTNPISAIANTRRPARRSGGGVYAARSGSSCVVDSSELHPHRLDHTPCSRLVSGDARRTAVLLVRGAVPDAWARNAKYLFRQASWVLDRAGTAEISPREHLPLQPESDVCRCRHHSLRRSRSFRIVESSDLRLSTVRLVSSGCGFP